MAKSASLVTTTIPSEVDEEPPSNHQNSPEAKDEEPPGKRRFASIKNALFASVPASDWNDWKWHFSDRIRTGEGM